MDRKTYLELRRSLDLQWDRWALPRHYFMDLTLLTCAAFILVASPSWGLSFFAAPFISVLMFRNFGLMHEGSHRLISKNNQLNDLAGIVAGGISLLPFKPWQASHLEHHFWSGNVQKDPVMAFIHIYPKLPSGMRSLLNVSWRFWIPIMAVLQHGVFWFLCIRHAIRNWKNGSVVASVLSPLVVWSTLVVAVSSLDRGAVLVAAVLSYLVMVEVVNLPHHMDLPQARGEVKYPVWEQHQSSRTCLYPLWASRFVVLNFNYHIEHHMFPDVPWYKLPEIHFHLREILKDEYNKDPQFEWILDHRKVPLAQVLTVPEPRQAPLPERAPGQEVVA